MRKKHKKTGNRIVLRVPLVASFFTRFLVTRAEFKSFSFGSKKNKTKEKKRVNYKL